LFFNICIFVLCCDGDGDGDGDGDDDDGDGDNNSLYMCVWHAT
jgi:hypothetical protein